MGVKKVSGNKVPIQAAGGIGRDSIHFIRVCSAAVHDHIGGGPIGRIQGDVHHRAGERHDVGCRCDTGCTADEELIAAGGVEDIGIGCSGIGRCVGRVHAAVNHGREGCTRQWRDDALRVDEADATGGRDLVDVRDFPQAKSADHDLGRSGGVERPLGDERESSVGYGKHRGRERGRASIHHVERHQLRRIARKGSVQIRVCPLAEVLEPVGAPVVDWSRARIIDGHDGTVSSRHVSPIVRASQHLE